MIQINRNYPHNECHCICNLITPRNIGIHISRIIHFAHYWVSHILHSVPDHNPNHSGQQKYVKLQHHKNTTVWTISQTGVQ